IKHLKKQEQVELITDPLSLSIVNLIADKPVTKEWVASQLDERYDMISNYIDEMVKYEILVEQDNDEGVKTYIRAARNFEIGKMTSFSRDIYNHWVLGMVNHIENNMLDMVRLIGMNDPEKFFTDLDTVPPSFSNSILRLTEEEVKELRDFYSSFVERHHRYQSEKEDSEDKKLYEINLIMHPHIPDLRGLLKKKEEN
ncbi:MAG: hypothetical protein UMV23_05045, partial [Halanaerobium sp.]|nr:hypothetical protein [Halanaerobium sp.]